MKVKRLLYCLFVIYVFQISVFAQIHKYEPGVIIVKFQSLSKEYTQWLASGRNNLVQELSGILGEHDCLPFVNDALLHLLSKKTSSKNLIYNNTQTPAENLRRICLIRYNSNIPPEIVAAKISGFDFIKYAEPLPIKKIVSVPNDSLIYRQYYLNQIKIYDAWDIAEPDSNIIIGIVDTGIDYNHEDLKDKIWTNVAETGKDDKGNDKSTNGIDDDNNGYIDDWHGWDFVSSENPNGDNDPHPGHEHGTHVGGIAAAVTNNIRGIAGIARGARLMAVKVADDNPLATSVANSYQGILYAASMGADVINCSWGSESRSEAEMEILKTAASLGSLIVAAAGNDGHEVPFFPAAHEDVLSVASVNFDDERSSFSNYHHTVDISSPGEDIYSSVPGNEYDYLSGTSMASPVVSGVAALVRNKYPEYSPLQVKEHLKASSDNTDTLNPNFIGKIGRGRVNALKAMQSGTFKSVVLESYSVSDENADKILDNGEKVEVSFSFKNVLSPLTGARVEASFKSSYNPVFINRELSVGIMGTLDVRQTTVPVSFIVPSDLPVNYEMLLELMFFDGNEYINSEFISLIFHPSYRTMDANDITVTFNSTGNIGFNDYPGNFQGDGFHYRTGTNLLYEGALMLGIPKGKVSDAARGSQQMEQDKSFNSFGSFLISNPGSVSAEEGDAEFSSYSNDINIDANIKQKVYQFNEEQNNNFIIVVYDIVNSSTFTYDSLYAALYFDWDIGTSGSNNIAKFDDTLGFGFVKNMAQDTLPYTGVAMLSSHKLNFFAIDNDGETLTNPGVWDGFDRSEKWMMMSSGIYRKVSSVTDVSIVIGAGPIKLKSGDTTRVAFSLFAEYNLGLLRETCRQARKTAKEYGIANGTYNPLPKSDSIISLYPNPLIEDFKIDFALSESSYITIDVFNSIGMKVYTPVHERFLTAGYQTESIKLPKMAQGRYYLRISTTTSRIIEPFELMY